MAVSMAMLLFCQAQMSLLPEGEEDNDNGKL